MKQNLNKQISKLTKNEDDHMAGLVGGTQKDLIGVMDQLSPRYPEARATFEAMSQPINRMDVGKALFDKFSPAMNGFRKSPVLNGCVLDRGAKRRLDGPSRNRIPRGSDGGHFIAC